MGHRVALCTKRELALQAPPSSICRCVGGFCVWLVDAHRPLRPASAKRPMLWAAKHQGADDSRLTLPDKGHLHGTHAVASYMTYVCISRASIPFVSSTQWLSHLLISVPSSVARSGLGS